MQAAIEGTKEIGLAVMATTLSLLAVFLPIGFMGGIIGTLHVVVRIHGVVRHRGFAAGVFHAHADAELALHQDAAAGRNGGAHTARRIRKFFHFLDRHYTRMLEWAMAHRKIMVALCVAVSL